MALTVGMLREILKDTTIDDTLPVAFVHWTGNREIAESLFISENTVKNHVRNILEKLQIHSRIEAVMIAVREKLIEFS